MTVFHQSSRKTITGHSPLRSALRDTQTYSSDLQGDADVRDYRQLPLEVDPPLHHLYRSALAPYFVKPAIEKHAERFRRNSEKILKFYFTGEPKEVVGELALPLVMHNLGVIYNRPQDVEEWISWGPDVWTAESETRDGAVLHRYLDSVYEEALRDGTKDIYGEIANLEIAGKRITPIEFRGIVGVLLAGGRDPCTAGSPPGACTRGAHRGRRDLGWHLPGVSECAWRVSGESQLLHGPHAEGQELLPRSGGRSGWRPGVACGSCGAGGHRHTPSTWSIRTTGT